MKTLTYAKAGFTLVELVVVVVILAILAAVVVPVVGDKVDAARVTAARGTMKEISNAFNQYHVDTSAWPSNTPVNFTITTAELDFYDYTCLYTNSGNKPNWNGPYLNDGLMDNGTMKVATAASNDGFRDPWKKPFRIFNFAEGYSGGQGAIMILSPGQNGIIDSKAADVYADRPLGDDLVQVVTRKLSVGLNK
jgi:type II secretion system protein G